jgi:2-keto-4-pentenoate hydratase/2-oxohepta-3-ene-1,7-dioic acid hydratase in catechol pathway
VVVVTGDVPLGASREEARAAVRLLGLANDVSLRNLIPGELGKGFGFFQSKPASAFSPVAVTPDARRLPGATASCTASCWSISTATPSAGRKPAWT